MSQSRETQEKRQEALKDSATLEAMLNTLPLLGEEFKNAAKRALLRFKEYHPLPTAQEDFATLNTLLNNINTLNELQSFLPVDHLFHKQYEKVLLDPDFGLNEETLNAIANFIPYVRAQIFNKVVGPSKPNKIKMDYTQLPQQNTDFHGFTDALNRDEVHLIPAEYQKFLGKVDGYPNTQLDPDFSKLDAHILAKLNAQKAINNAVFLQASLLTSKNIKGDTEAIEAIKAIKAILQDPLDPEKQSCVNTLADKAFDAKRAHQDVSRTSDEESAKLAHAYLTKILTSQDLDLIKESDKPKIQAAVAAALTQKDGRTIILESSYNKLIDLASTVEQTIVDRKELDAQKRLEREFDSSNESPPAVAGPQAPAGLSSASDATLATATALALAAQVVVENQPPVAAPRLGKDGGPVAAPRNLPESHA